MKASHRIPVTACASLRSKQVEPAQGFKNLGNAGSERDRWIGCKVVHRVSGLTHWNTQGVTPVCWHHSRFLDPEFGDAEAERKGELGRALVQAIREPVLCRLDTIVTLSHCRTTTAALLLWSQNDELPELRNKKAKEACRLKWVHNTRTCAGRPR